MILVNGAPWPVHEVDAARYRLRILNASNARHYELEAVTDDGRRLDLVQIGADQGLLAAPVTHRLLPIAPAERYDVIIDFSGVPVGGRVRLVNRLGSGPHPRRDGLPRRARRHRRQPHPATRSSDDLPTWRRSDAVRVRDFSFRAGQHARRARLADRRAAVRPRPLRCHRRGSATSRCGGWSPTSTIPSTCTWSASGCSRAAAGRRCRTTPGSRTPSPCDPAKSVEIITRFDGYRGRYLFHCHNAEHEDMGMMANLEIV